MKFYKFEDENYENLLQNILQVFIPYDKIFPKIPFLLDEI